MISPVHLGALMTAKLVAASRRNGEIHLGPHVLAFGIPLLHAAQGARIDIASDVRLVSISRWTPLGVNHRVVIRALRSGAQVSIGEGTGISGGAICAATSISIGRGCLLGANVHIFDTDFHPVDSRFRAIAELPESDPRHAVVIADNVFIGAGAVILKGVRIGANSVVGAGSVVTMDCSENTIVGGNPAREIGRVVIDGS